MELAPIALLVYNRPWHTQQTVEALLKNELASDSELFIYADGGKEEHDKNVQKVRKYIRTITGFKKITIIERNKNCGLADNIIDGVTTVVNEFGKIIVLEDDILTSPFFLTYCNDGLEIYKNANQVYSINSYMFPIQIEKADMFLSPLATSTWGWATWADRWKYFELLPRYKSIIQTNLHLRNRFNLADYDYASMLDNTNSWGIRWYYSVFIRNGLGVFPTKSLSMNIGFGESASHTKKAFDQMGVYLDEIKVVLKEEIDIEMHSVLLKHFTKNRNNVLLHRMFKRIKNFLIK